jgi:hypothetical protein
MFGLNVESINIEEKDLAFNIDLDRNFTLEDM